MSLDLANLTRTMQNRSARWTAGETIFSRADTRSAHLRLGFNPSPEALSLKNRENLSRAHLAGARLAMAAAPPLYPETHDWRSASGKSYVTAIKDQNQCGACCAFGAIAAIEATYQVGADAPASDINLSEAHLFFCYARDDNRVCGCNNEPNAGWWPEGALNAAMAGIASTASFPYPDEVACADYDCTNLNATWQSTAMKITGWHSLTSLNDMKTWLSMRGPLVTTMSVYEDFFRAYSSGIYHYVNGDLIDGHCISVVGYDDSQEYWICKNSWGMNWGEAGFFRIAYGECGIDATMWAVEGVIPY